MDKIYSRPRMRLPKIHAFYEKSRNRKDRVKLRKFATLIAIIIISLSVFWGMTNSITPIFDKLCLDKVRGLATIISNEQATNIMKEYEYQDLITIHKDKEENITMMTSNIILINKIISDVPIRIQKEINKEDSQDLDIRLGSITGIRYFAGRGPKIPIKVEITGNVETDFKSSFDEVGINQTLHRVYLNVACNVSVLTPYKTIDDQIINQVILAENIIVGKIPSSYYNLEGITTENTTHLME